MATTMTIANTDWTWRALATRYDAEFATLMHAYLIEHTAADFAKSYHVDGWSFADGAFTGPALTTSNVPDWCDGMIGDAIDHATEQVTGVHRVVCGSDGCGDPITAEFDRKGMWVKGSERTEHRPDCWEAR